MSTVRSIAGLAALGIALAMPGFALAEGTGKSQAPASRIVESGIDTKDGTSKEINSKDTKSKFIYLDDGTVGDDHSALKNVPARSVFRIDQDRASADMTQLGIKARKRPVLVLSPQTTQAFAGIRVDGFGATSEQRSTIQINSSQKADGKKSKSARDGIDVWVSTESSSANAAQTSAGKSLDLALDPTTSRPNYNVGLNVGYHGFTVGAALLREQSGLDLTYQGFDLGVGYLGHSWYTKLQVAGFRNDGNPLSYNFMGERFRAVELGAGYVIWPGFTFSGRFKYFDYGSPLFVGGQNEDQHIFSLDTRLNF